MQTYVDEREGQVEFFENFGVPYEDEIPVEWEDEDDEVLADSTDGVFNGVLFEFKLVVDPNPTLFQAIKYCSRRRLLGKPCPATILLVSLHEHRAYAYHASDYKEEIHRVYSGGASLNNSGLVAHSAPFRTYEYAEMLDASDLRRLIASKRTRAEKYMPVRIDNDSVVGWAERYYRENPDATKGDFLGDDTGTQIRLRGEIREPRTFRDLIEPYARTDNTEFARVMDCLNDRLRKKELGAFFTPEPYARLAARLVLRAVERVPEGNDYIILDRCAGTGNLELALEGLVGPDGTDLLSHCVVSTYEYYEYKVLFANLNGLVREIIPPTEANVVYESGLVANADAMSEGYVNNPVIKRYVDDPHCSVILLENPPFHDSTSNSSGNVATRGAEDSFVKARMSDSYTGAVLNDISNHFIWSGFAYYLRQETDSYVVFSPLKYWKAHHVCTARFGAGYLFNRKHFHATPSAISCILWENLPSEDEQIALQSYDIVDGEVVAGPWVDVRKVNNTPNALFERRKSDGYIGYVNCSGFNLNAASRGLYRTPWELKGHGSCFYLLPDGYLEKLPLWVSKLVPQDQWYEKDVFYTTSDGGDAYTHDPSFLKSCLIYTCLSNQNKCLSFCGPDGRDYQNELCLDDTDGRAPLALRDLRAYAEDPATALDGDEEGLVGLWRKVLEQARGCEGYDPKWSYGVYQISLKVDTRHNAGTEHRKIWVYDHPQLHSDLDTLRVRLKGYYKSHITPKMFQYQLLK